MSNSQYHPTTTELQPADAHPLPTAMQGGPPHELLLFFAERERSKRGPVAALATAATTSAEDDRAAVLGRCHGHDADDLRDPALLAGLRQRLREIPDPTSDEGLAEMRQHLPVLEGLMLSLIDDARTARKTEDRVRLARAALQAQQAYARSFALLRTLGLQKAGSVGVVIHDGDHA
ncbi:hypothetical protein ACU6VI_05125 [Sphaerotilus natans]